MRPISRASDLPRVTRVIVALVVELGLHRVKEITIEDGGLLTGDEASGFRLELHLTGVVPNCADLVPIGPFRHPARRLTK
jgi:hypothetical protein